MTTSSRAPSSFFLFCCYVVFRSLATPRLGWCKIKTFRFKWSSNRRKSLSRGQKHFQSVHTTRRWAALPNFPKTFHNFARKTEKRFMVYLTTSPGSLVSLLIFIRWKISKTLNSAIWILRWTCFMVALKLYDDQNIARASLDCPLHSHEVGH